MSVCVCVCMSHITCRVLAVYNKNFAKFDTTTKSIYGFIHITGLKLMNFMYTGSMAHLITS